MLNGRLIDRISITLNTQQRLNSAYSPVVTEILWNDNGRAVTVGSEILIAVRVLEPVATSNNVLVSTKLIKRMSMISSEIKNGLIGRQVGSPDRS